MLLVQLKTADAASESDTSNKPFEWSGHHQLTASPPQAPCLPLKGGVRRIERRAGAG